MGALTICRGQEMSILREGRDFIRALYSIEALLALSIFALAYGGDWGAMSPVPLRAVFIFGALVLLFLFLLNHKWSNSRSYYMAVATYGLFISYMAVSALWSPSSEYATTKLTEILTTGVPLFLLFSFGFFRPESGKYFYYSVIVLAAVTLFHLYQVLSTEPMMLEERMGSYQFIGLSFGFYAATMLAGLVLHRNHLLILLVSSTVFVFCCGILVLLGGRSGVLVLLVTTGSLMIVLLRPVKPDLIVFDRRRVMLLLILAAVSMGLAGTVYLMETPPLTIFRILWDGPEDILAGGSRAVFIQQAFQVWNDNPFFGTGTGGFPMAAGHGDVGGHYPHNTFMELLAEQGLIGTILYLALLVLALRHFWRWAGEIEDLNFLLPFVLFIGASAASFVTGDLSSNYLHCGLGALLSPSWRTINISETSNAYHAPLREQDV